MDDSDTWTDGIPNLKLPDPAFVPGTPAPVLELVDVWVASIDKKQCNAVLKEVSAKAPLNALMHVKRVQKREGDDESLRVLLCECSDVAPDGAWPAPVRDLVER